MRSGLGEDSTGKTAGRAVGDRAPNPSESAPPLQLAVTRKGVGLELSRPRTIGPLRVDRLEIALPSLRFPVDLSGGVGKFRHRRGVLGRLEVAIDRLGLEELARRKLAEIFASPRVSLLADAGGVAVGIAAESWALAFRLRFAPTGDWLRFVVEDARAEGLRMPAHEAALIATATAFGSLGRRTGSVFSLIEPAGRLLREVSLETGTRLPETAGLAWQDWTHRDGEWRLVLTDGDRADAFVPTPATAAAIELSSLLAAADDALALGKRDDARALYLLAWEQAPLDGNIARRIAEIDACEQRPEAGLAILTTTESAVLAGALGGALLAAAGDRDGARDALSRAGDLEPFAPLAALCLARAASLTDHPGERAELLKAALSRAPTVEALRWPRLAVLLELGDERAAQAEAEGVSAIAPLGRRFEVSLRLGNTFLDRGHPAAAKVWFERALLFSPRSPDAMIGLGEAMVRAQLFGRATEVLARAAETLERADQPRGRALVPLARALAEGAGELPLAIARVRAVRPEEPAAVEARYWEAVWLAKLGDRAEASLAFVRMLEAQERWPHPSAERAAGWLADAARFEREERGDLALAKRHLGFAIRLRAKDPSLLAEFRRVARDLEGGRPVAPPSAIVAPVEHEAPEAAAVTPAAGAVDARGPKFLALPVTFGGPDVDAREGEDDDVALVERLSDRLRGDPENLEITFELAGALERLGRDLELLGVLSARIDDGDEETRALFLPIRRTTLERLARRARDEGRAAEAELYESMAKA